MLNGKRVIITGASQGFGKETAKEFVKQGADICICARDADQLNAAANELHRYSVRENQKIIHKKTDIGITEEIEGLYDYAVRELGGIDCVVNNAGIYGPIGPSDEVPWDRLEQVIAINLLGTLYSMRKAAAILKRQGKGGSIINLSGGGAVSPKPNFMGYSISKAAIVRATENMALECQQDKIYINAVAPGAMNTRLLAQLLEAGEEAVGKAIYEKAVIQKDTGGASLENAARLVVYLASGKAGNITGRLISAVWDDWNNIGLHADEIESSDVYTLRRILPEDREFKWK